MANGADHWFQRRYGDELSGPIAYFCAEYGFHESLGIYSGGLGVLAGDHMKTASDMALPAIGVGLLYRKGYFRQSIDADGHQEHDYPDYDLGRLPLSRVQDSVRPATDGDRRAARARPVGRRLARPGRAGSRSCCSTRTCPRTPTPTGPITNILYVRGREMRLHQEIVLGIGGVRALRALGLAPAVWHLNEGHSAFLLAERARELVRGGHDASTRPGRPSGSDSVFTIHTPVSAGNERFDADLVRRVAGPLLDSGGVPVDRVLELGLGVDGDPGQFDMTAFSLRLTQRRERRQPAPCARPPTRPGRASSTTRSSGITNGVHGPTWVGEPIAELLEDLGRRPRRPRREHRGRGGSGSASSGSRARDLWEAHLRQKRELAHLRPGPPAQPVRPARRSAGGPRRARDALDPDVLTIGFARRFATYKRAGLLFSDIDRLARMLWDADRPVQIVFAGKAHPADRPGQKRHPGDLPALALARSSAAASSSSRTTTCGSAASSSRASTSGSTTRAGRWRPRARRA